MSRVATADTRRAGHLTLGSAREGADSHIAVSGELDIASAGALEAEVARAEATDAQRIVVDLGAVGFIDSSGLRALLAVDARSRRDGDRLRLRNPSPAVEQVLRITGADRMLRFRS